MHARYFAALLVASAASAFASPNPAALEARQVVSDIVSGATSVFGEVTRGAASVGGEITSHAAGAFQTVTSVVGNGQVITVVSSVGGEAITLAASGAGVVKTFGESIYTVATGAAGAQFTGNAAPQSLHGQSTLLVGAATVITSVLLGAFVTL